VGRPLLGASENSELLLMTKEQLPCQTMDRVTMEENADRDFESTPVPATPTLSILTCC
jgi:hypothetical protein